MHDNICGAKTRAGHPCKRPAGWGTDHVGSGRCRMHGGASVKGVEHPNFKHGRRSKHWDPNCVVEFASWKESIGPAFGVEDDLLYLLWLAREGLKPGAAITVNTKDGPVEIFPDPRYIAGVGLDLARMWETIVKRHEGETVYVKLAQPEVEAAFRAMGAAVAKHVSDPAEAEALRADLAAALEKIAEGEA
jgi:hypothetical protein